MGLAKRKEDKEGGTWPENYIPQKQALKELLKNKKVRDKFRERTARCETALFVKSTRLSANKTQKQLADNLGVSQARVAEIENPLSDESITIAQLDEIAEVCGGNLKITFTLIR